MNYSTIKIVVENQDQGGRLQIVGEEKRGRS